MSQAKRGLSTLKRLAHARSAFTEVDLKLQRATRRGEDTPALHAEWREKLDALAALVAESEHEVAALV